MDTLHIHITLFIDYQPCRGLRSGVAHPHRSLVWHRTSTQPFARYGKGMCTCACAETLCKTLMQWASSHRGVARDFWVGGKNRRQCGTQAVAGTGGYRCRSNTKLIGWWGWHRTMMTARELVIPFQRYYRRLKSVTTAGRPLILTSPIYRVAQKKNVQNFAQVFQEVSRHEGDILQVCWASNLEHMW